MVRGGSRKCNVKYIVPDDTRESNFTKKEWTQKWENTTTVEVQKYTLCVLVREGERFRSWLCTGWFFIIWQSVPPHQSSLLHGKTDYKSRSKLFREQKLVVSSSTFTRSSQNVPWDQRPPHPGFRVNSSLLPQILLLWAFPSGPFVALQKRLSSMLQLFSV